MCLCYRGLLARHNKFAPIVILCRMRQLVRPSYGAVRRAQHSLLSCASPTRLRFAAAAAVAATASVAAASQATACDKAPSAASGLNEHGEVTLEALVGRSLAHLKVTTGTVSVRGLEVRWWRYENPERCDKPPVVALHGGPSMTHHSLKPLVLLADEGHPVILYDQACNYICQRLQPNA